VNPALETKLPLALGMVEVAVSSPKPIVIIDLAENRDFNKNGEVGVACDDQEVELDFNAKSLKRFIFLPLSRQVLQTFKSQPTPRYLA
jgi:hypothetical protein